MFKNSGLFSLTQLLHLFQQELTTQYHVGKIMLYFFLLIYTYNRAIAMTGQQYIESATKKLMKFKFYFLKHSSRRADTLETLSEVLQQGTRSFPKIKFWSGLRLDIKISHHGTGKWK